ncbi:hypothetical protein FRC98_09500 [Lujinxingia vulgaris]|uniref:Uncharacterized protein n=1 Tax=Lujinxingia vulgaris TaxID=2600176 RepID=A0A5C6X9A4_9DELT|nr:Ig-like domain-containing protein [Lujinxingia vulgaris]TXD36966.1 hypothetical protein FRC98_09500 [Lujinxingia vulgaris]
MMSTSPWHAFLLPLFLAPLLGCSAADDPTPEASDSARATQALDIPLDAYATLIAEDGAASHQYGEAIAADGDTLLVGAMGDNENGVRSGAAYIFQRNPDDPTGWVQVKKLAPGDPGTNFRFGYAVALHGDVALVGAPYNSTRDNGAGAAYIFHRDEGGPDNWGQVKRLLPADIGDSDQFGSSVALDGELAAVSASRQDHTTDTLDSGAVYLFARDEGGPDVWGEFKKITPEVPASGGRFGFALALSGDDLLVGAPKEDITRADSGAAYIFNRNTGGPDAWGQLQKLVPANEAISIEFGASLAMDNGLAIFGLPYDDVNDTRIGSVYVFGRDEGGPDTWGQVTRLVREDGIRNDYFGMSVAIKDRRLVVGASQVTVDDRAYAGAAYVYERAEGSPLSAWGRGERITLNEVELSDKFGSAVALTERDVFVSAPLDDFGTVTVFGQPNTAPVAEDGTAQTAENQPLTLTLQATDSDGDPLTFSIITEPLNGSVTLAGDQATYTPNTGFRGNDTFTFEVSDGGLSDTATVTIEVTPPDNTTPDAGEVDAGEGDAGDEDAGEVDAGDNDPGDGDAGDANDGPNTPTAEASGCGCTSTSGAPANALLLLTILGLMGLQRRRR